MSVGHLESSFFLQGNANGIFEDPIFLSYFLVALLVVVATFHVVESMHKTVNSLAGLARYEDTTKDLDPQFRSSLNKEDLHGMYQLYEYLIAHLRFEHPNPATSLPPEYLKTARILLRIRWGLFAAGLIFLAFGSLAHWSASTVYGFDIWASSRYPLGFGVRMAYEFLLYAVLVPYAAFRTFISIFIIHHSLTTMERKKGVKFVRFAIDEAGGFGEYGRQSFRNTLVVFPFIIPILFYFIFYPVTPILVVGVVAFSLTLPMVFFWPLLGARRSMVKMKIIELKMMGDSLNSVYEAFKESLARQAHEDMTKSSDALAKAEKFHQDVIRLPAWPFSKSVVTQFFSIIGLIVTLTVTKMMGLI